MFLRKLKIELSYDSVTPLVIIHLRYQSSYDRDTCTPMFTATLFTITKSWNQPTYQSTIIHIYTMEYHSTTKNSEIMSLARKWIELDIIMVRYISWRQKEKYLMFSLIC
jgi:hypothetical protein